MAVGGRGYGEGKRGSGSERCAICNHPRTSCKMPEVLANLKAHLQG